jgi:hypothetical protein
MFVPFRLPGFRKCRRNLSELNYHPSSNNDSPPVDRVDAFDIRPPSAGTKTLAYFRDRKYANRSSH